MAAYFVIYTNTHQAGGALNLNNLANTICADHFEVRGGGLLFWADAEKKKLVAAIAGGTWASCVPFDGGE